MLVGQRQGGCHRSRGWPGPVLPLGVPQAAVPSIPVDLHREEPLHSIFIFLVFPPKVSIVH